MQVLLQKFTPQKPKYIPTEDFIDWISQREVHCVESVPIRNYSGPHFPAVGLNTERYGVSVRIQFEYGKMRTWITPNTNTTPVYICVTYNKFTGLNGIILWIFTWLLKSSNCSQCCLPSAPAEFPIATKPIGVRSTDLWWRISHKISPSKKQSLLKSNSNFSLNSGCLLLFWVVVVHFLTRDVLRYKHVLTETSKIKFKEVNCVKSLRIRSFFGP